MSSTSWMKELNQQHKQLTDQGYTREQATNYLAESVSANMNQASNAALQEQAYNAVSAQKQNEQNTWKATKADYETKKSTYEEKKNKWKNLSSTTSTSDREAAYQDMNRAYAAYKAAETPYNIGAEEERLNNQNWLVRTAKAVGGGLADIGHGVAQTVVKAGQVGMNAISNMANTFDAKEAGVYQFMSDNAGKYASTHRMSQGEWNSLSVGDQDFIKNQLGISTLTEFNSNLASADSKQYAKKESQESTAKTQAVFENAISPMDTYSQRMANEATYGTSGLGKLALEMIPSAVGMAFDAATGGITGGPLTSMGLRVFGSSYADAKKQGADEGRATLYALLDTAKEVGTEMIGGEAVTNALVYKNKGLFNSAVDNLIAKIPNRLLQGITLHGVGALEESLEEVAATFLDPFVQAVLESDYGAAVREKFGEQRASDYARAAAGATLLTVACLPVGTITGTTSARLNEINTTFAIQNNPLLVNQYNSDIAKGINADTAKAKVTLRYQMGEDVYAEYSKQRSDDQNRAAIEAYAKADEAVHFNNVTKGQILLDQNDDAIGKVVEANEHGFVVEMKDASGKTIKQAVVKFGGRYGMLDSNSALANGILNQNWTIMDEGYARTAEEKAQAEAKTEQREVPEPTPQTANIEYKVYPRADNYYEVWGGGKQIGGVFGNYVQALNFAEEATKTGKIPDRATPQAQPAQQQNQPQQKAQPTQQKQQPKAQPQQRQQAPQAEPSAQDEEFLNDMADADQRGEKVKPQSAEEQKQARLQQLQDELNMLLNTGASQNMIENVRKQINELQGKSEMPKQNVLNNTKYKIDKDSNGKFIVLDADGTVMGGTYDTYADALGLVEQMSQTPSESPQNASQSVSQEEGNSVLPNEQNASETQNEELNSKPESDIRPVNEKYHNHFNKAYKNIQNLWMFADPEWSDGHNVGSRFYLEGYDGIYIEMLESEDNRVGRIGLFDADGKLLARSDKASFRTNPATVNDILSNVLIKLSEITYDGDYSYKPDSGNIWHDLSGRRFKEDLNGEKITLSGGTVSAETVQDALMGKTVSEGAADYEGTLSEKQVAKLSPVQVIQRLQNYAKKARTSIKGLLKHITSDESGEALIGREAYTKQLIESSVGETRGMNAQGEYEDEVDVIGGEDDTRKERPKRSVEEAQEEVNDINRSNLMTIGDSIRDAMKAANIGRYRSGIDGICDWILDKGRQRRGDAPTQAEHEAFRDLVKKMLNDEYHRQNNYKKDKKGNLVDINWKKFNTAKVLDLIDTALAGEADVDALNDADFTEINALLERAANIRIGYGETKNSRLGDVYSGYMDLRSILEGDEAFQEDLNSEIYDGTNLTAGEKWITDEDGNEIKVSDEEGWRENPKEQEHSSWSDRSDAREGMTEAERQEYEESYWAQNGERDVANMWQQKSEQTGKGNSVVEEYLPSTSPRLSKKPGVDLPTSISGVTITQEANELSNAAIELISKKLREMGDLQQAINRNAQDIADIKANPSGNAVVDNAKIKQHERMIESLQKRLAPYETWASKIEGQYTINDLLNDSFLTEAEKEAFKVQLDKDARFGRIDLQTIALNNRIDSTTYYLQVGDGMFRQLLDTKTNTQLKAIVEQHEQNIKNLQRRIADNKEYVKSLNPINKALIDKYNKAIEAAENRLAREQEWLRKATGKAGSYTLNDYFADPFIRQYYANEVKGIDTETKENGVPVFGNYQFNGLRNAKSWDFANDLIKDIKKGVLSGELSEHGFNSRGEAGRSLNGQELGLGETTVTEQNVYDNGGYFGEQPTTDEQRREAVRDRNARRAAQGDEETDGLLSGTQGRDRGESGSPRVRTEPNAREQARQKYQANQRTEAERYNNSKVVKGVQITDETGKPTRSATAKDLGEGTFLEGDVTDRVIDTSGGNSADTINDAFEELGIVVNGFNGNLWHRHGGFSIVGDMFVPRSRNGHTTRTFGFTVKGRALIENITGSNRDSAIRTARHEAQHNINDRMFPGTDHDARLVDFAKRLIKDAGLDYDKVTDRISTRLMLLGGTEVDVADEVLARIADGEGFGKNRITAEQATELYRLLTDSEYWKQATYRMTNLQNMFKEGFLEGGKQDVKPLQTINSSSTVQEDAKRNALVWKEGNTPEDRVKGENLRFADSAPTGTDYNAMPYQYRGENLHGTTREGNVGLKAPATEAQEKATSGSNLGYRYRQEFDPYSDESFDALVNDTSYEEASDGKLPKRTFTLNNDAEASFGGSYTNEADNPSNPAATGNSQMGVVEDYGINNTMRNGDVDWGDTAPREAYLKRSEQQKLLDEMQNELQDMYQNDPNHNDTKASEWWEDDSYVPNEDHHNSNWEKQYKGKLTGEQIFNYERETNPEDGPEAADEAKKANPWNRIKDANRRITRVSRGSALNNAEKMDRITGGNSGARNTVRNYQNLTKMIDNVMSGKANVVQMYHMLEDLRGSKGIGQIVDDRIVNLFHDVANYERAVYAAGGPESQSKLALTYKYAMANAMDALTNNIERVNSIEYDQKLKLIKNAEQYGKGGSNSAFVQARQWLNRMQMSGGNFWRMIDGYNRGADGIGYQWQKRHDAANATQIETQAKAFAHFAGLSKVDGFADFANGKAKGEYGSLLQEVSLYKMMNTVRREYRKYNPLTKERELKVDWSRVTNSKGFDIVDNKGKVVRHIEANEDLDSIFEILRNDIENNKAATAYMNAMDSMFGELAPELAKTSKNVLGYERTMYDFGKYFPVSYMEKGSNGYNYNMEEELGAGLSGFGNMKSRKQQVEKTYQVAPASMVVDQYIQQASNYVAYAEIGADLKLMLDGNGNTGSFMDVVGRQFGSTYGQWFKNYVKDMNGIKTEDPSGVNKWLARGRGLMQQGAIIGSVSIPIKQTASYFNAMGVVDPRAVAMAYKGPTRSGNAKRINNPFMQSRTQGSIDPEVSQFLRSDWITKMRNKGGAAATLVNMTNIMDARTVANVYEAVLFDVQMNSGFTTSELIADAKSGQLTAMGEMLVNSKFEEAVLNTQPIFTKQARPELSRTSNEFIKMLSTFRTQQMQNYNRMLTSINEYRAAKTYGGDTVTTGANLRATIGGQIASAASLAALTCLADAVLHKLKKYKDEDGRIDPGKVLGRWSLNTVESLTGNALFLGDLTKWAYDKVRGALDDNYTDQEFYGISMGAISSVRSVLNACSWLCSDLKNYGGKHLASNTRYVVNYISTLAGIPTQNAYAIVNSFVQWTAGVDGRGESEDILKEWDKARTDYGNRFYNYIAEGKTEKANAMMEKMGDSFLTKLKATGLQRLQSGESDDDDVFQMLTTYGGMFDDSARDAISSMHYQIDTGSKLGSMKDDWMEGIITREEAIAYQQKYNGKTKAEAEKLIQNWERDRASQAVYGYSYANLDDAYRSGYLSDSAYKSALMNIGGKTEAEAEATVNQQNFKDAFGESYSKAELKRQLEAGTLTDSAYKKWYMLCEVDADEDSAQYDLDQSKNEIKFGHEPDYKHTSDYSTVYASKTDKLGIDELYDQFGSYFTSPKSLGKVFNDFVELKKTSKYGEMSYDYKGANTPMSAEYVAQVKALNKNIANGNITYEAAKIIWHEKWGRSLWAGGPWQFVKAA